MCPPGLPLLMTAARLVRVTPFAIVPLSGALAVWLTFLLGRTLDTPSTGAAAAVLLACSPIFLFQVVQPMSDVPAATCWLLATFLVLRGNAMGAGLAASMAILIRPNLLPLAAVLAVYVASTRGAGRAILSFVAGLVPGIATLAVLQLVMYGSPVATGYGSPGELFKTAHVLPNLARYTRWMIEGHTPVVLLALASPFVLARRADAWLGLALAATTLGGYLPYLVFDDWWYLRFLLPAIPVLIVLAVATIARASRPLLPRSPGLVLAIAVCILGALFIRIAERRQAFELQRLERHFIDAGTFAAERLSNRAAVLTVRHSGSVQYYARLPTVSWDTLEPDALDRTLFFLNAHGLVPFLMLDATEESAFRSRFGSQSRIGQLDWPPIARVGRTIRVYDPADRARYLAGARIEPVDWPARSR